MKKCIAILLCICALSVTASAAYNENLSAYDEYVLLYGEPPVVDDFVTNEEYHAAYDVWEAGLESYAMQRALYFDSLAAEREAARIAAAEEAAQETAEAEPPVILPETIESAGSNYENHSIVPLSSGSDDKYPVGSYVDPAGNVHSPDGMLLSPGTTPAYAPVSGSVEDGALLPDESADTNDLPAVEDPDTLAVIAALVSDIVTDPPTWYVDDLRPTDPPVEVLTGLKSLVTSIFGEYTPVTTTSVISETVGNDTHQYLVETVAPGAAGVDYEWVAGVLLFAIMLYCLMKLLGGVLK